MFAPTPLLRKAAAWLVALGSLLWLSACEPVSTAAMDGLPAGEPVRVALLVPGGSAQSTDNLIARNLENAARMAIADLRGAEVDLRVYNTAANAAQAASVAEQAVAEGAQVIVGPFYSAAAQAAGAAVAGSGVNVLTFSNNTAVAGGNVFLLNTTFETTADRLVDFAVARGIDDFLIAHSDDLQGQVGRAAIENAVRANGGRVTGVESYPFSQQGIAQAAPRIASTAQATGTEAIFTTANVSGDLPFLAPALAEAGVNTAATPLIGLTRWDAAPQAATIPALQGGFFAVPDPQRTQGFEGRYMSTYGTPPNPLAGLAYDGIAAIGALAAQGDAPSRAGLTRAAGFEGTGGVFRLRRDGTSQRALAVAQILNNQVVIVDPAPRNFGRAGF